MSQPWQEREYERDHERTSQPWYGAYENERAVARAGAYGNASVDGARALCSCWCHIAAGSLSRSRWCLDNSCALRYVLFRATTGALSSAFAGASAGSLSYAPAGADWLALVVWLASPGSFVDPSLAQSLVPQLARALMLPPADRPVAGGEPARYPGK